MPIFRAHRGLDRGKSEESNKPLPYHQHQTWVKRLGEETDLMQVLTTYCLR